MEKPFKDRLFYALKTMVFFVGLLWIILVLCMPFPFIKSLGIYPRSLAGIPGILTSPFIHLNFWHLMANTMSLFILGVIFFTVEKKLGFLILAHFVVIGGLGVWLIGRSAGGQVHIGASGVIYALIGYLIFNGIFRRNFKTILLSILIFVFYGGAIWGVLPQSSFISWESHLCGFGAGIITAYMYKNVRRD